MLLPPPANCPALYQRSRRTIPRASAACSRARYCQRLQKRGAQAFVFDLRGNGGGLVDEAQLIASAFLPDGRIVTTRGRNVPADMAWLPLLTWWQVLFDMTFAAQQQSGVFRSIGHDYRADLPPVLSAVLGAILLAILIAMVTQVIGDHIARAFSLVGALSIVRFRTVVEDTLDIAFVIFAVVVGMAVGANHLLVAVIGFVIVGAAALATQPRRSPNPWIDEDSRLTVRLGIGRSAETVLKEPLSTYCSHWSLVSGSTSQKGAAVEVTYRIRLRPGISPADTIDALNRLEGVQSVELRREL